MQIPDAMLLVQVYVMVDVIPLVAVVRVVVKDALRVLALVLLVPRQEIKVLKVALVDAVVVRVVAQANAADALLAQLLVLVVVTVVAAALVEHHPANLLVITNVAVARVALLVAAHVMDAIHARANAVPHVVATVQHVRDVRVAAVVVEIAIQRVHHVQALVLGAKVVVQVVLPIAALVAAHQQNKLKAFI